MLVYGRLIIMFFVVSTRYALADPDPKVIAYDDLMSRAAIFSDTGVAYFSQLLFDVTREQLVVGARDTIYRLTIDGLQVLEKSVWPAAPDKITTCLQKGQSDEDCRNFVKVLLSDSGKLFACGTNAFSPLCSWREIENTSKVSNTASGIAKCPYSPHANVTSLMSDKGVYFAGTPMDFSGTDSAIVRDFAGPFIRTKQYDSKWLNEPQFVGSFETESYMYFLFRESAVEYMNCGKKIYSRIARVCKNDSGGQVVLRDNWTTFLKARLNCSIPGDYPFYFDEIQGFTYLSDEELVYATFTTPRNSIHGSAVCSFNLTAINAAFEGPYKHQESIGSAWEKRMSSNQNQKQCRNSDHRHLIDSSKYQLMDSAVQPVVQVPLYHSQLETIVHIAVDVIPTKLHRDQHIMYVSTEENIIKKISVLPRTMKTCVLEIWKPLINPMNKILSIRFLKSADSLYIGTKNEIIRIPSQHCERHKSKQVCLDAMDPYCGWNELKELCSPPPEKNPLTAYWQQSVTSCPTFTHPVPGGWSQWSSWSPCNQANSNTDQPDQCMCSVRQCNNPPPQNGGAYCEGVSIMVTNCTEHGGWTYWSEWSACSASCGVAIKTRKRSCSNPAPAFGGRVCVGPDTQEQYCSENPPCPQPAPRTQDGGWSSWSSWSECTARCGRGFRYRTRKCDNPPPQKPGGTDCQGCHVDYEICNDAPCSETKRLSSWTPWSKGVNGTEKRYRFSCRAPVSDSSLIKVTLAKEDEKICKPDGTCRRTDASDQEDMWSEWSPWSPCSAECGEGTQYRTRTCESKNDDCVGYPRMTKACNTHACKGEWSCWTDWSACSVTCGKGIKQRTRVCLSSSNRSVEGRNCDGQSISHESCEMPPCEQKGWLAWSDWSICDENNLQQRTRKCSVVNPSPNMCEGSDTDTRVCESDDISNNISPLQVQSAGESPSTTALVIFCFLAFMAGSCISAIFCYYWLKKHQHTIPSSPHYISKQNPYVTVPLKEVSTPKRTPSFSKNTLTSNGTTPKLFSQKSADYETATIKRNSHSLLNGHSRTSTLEQEKFF